MYQNKAKNTVFWRENLIKELQGKDSRVFR